MGAAYVDHLDDRLGTIEPGKLADFTVLDRNPLTEPAESVSELGVHATIVGGHTMWTSASGQTDP